MHHRWCVEPALHACAHMFHPCCTSPFVLLDSLSLCVFCCVVLFFYPAQLSYLFLTLFFCCCHFPAVHACETAHWAAVIEMGVGARFSFLLDLGGEPNLLLISPQEVEFSCRLCRVGGRAADATFRLRPSQNC